MLNVPSEVAEGVIADVEDWATTDTTEVTREEVERAVSKLKNGKASGSDEILPELVKNGGQAMVDWLRGLLREVWSTKQIPQEWKNVILIPLHKKKNRKACDNYRGIALLHECSREGVVPDPPWQTAGHNRVTASRVTVWISEGSRNY